MKPCLLPSYSTMNPGQEHAFNTVIEGKSIFLTGPGGTGKSYLINRLLENYQTPKFGQQSRVVAVTALTGCAALLLHSSAKTLHSWAGIGLGKEPVDVLVRSIKKFRGCVKRWKSTDILIIDEVSMMTAELFEKLEEIARTVRKVDAPFGGIQVVLVGEFFQLPPIVARADGPVPFVFESPVWAAMNFTVCKLTEIVRQKDPAFQAILNDARQGIVTPESLAILKSRMKPSKGSRVKPTMLFTRKADVDSINGRHLGKLEGERHTFTVSTVSSGPRVPVADLQKAVAATDANSTYCASLVLVKEAQVMLLVNTYATSHGLVNGSRGVVTGFETSEDGVILPVVEFRNGARIRIDYATWTVPIYQDSDIISSITGKSAKPVVLRKQIPLRLAYAITIHKAQGATLDCALIDVGDTTFEYGQAYVALSRLKDLEGLFIHDIDVRAFRAHPKVVQFYSAH